MPTQMKPGLSGGAAANAMNVVQWNTGIRLVRATVVDASDTVSARTILSRIANVVVAQDPYTLVTA